MYVVYVCIPYISSPNQCLLFGHMLQKEDTDWVKKCMAYGVEDSSPDQEVDHRGHGKRLCKKIVKHVI